MLPACNRGAGANLCFPDVCKTPPPPVVGHPVPYVNRAAHAIAVPFSPVVIICGLNALHLRSQIPVTTGDEAGIFGPGPKRVGKFVAGNPVVFVDGIPGVNLTSPATGNAANAAGAALVPDAVNVFYTHASGAGARAAPGVALPVDDLLAFRASLDDAPPLAGAMLEGGVAVLRIACFTADVPARAHHALRRLEAEGMRALVLDLRGNPGGELDACLHLAGGFLPAGSVLATVVDADGDETVHRSHGEHPYQVPLALLVDRGTASAAEVFAGCLQAHGRALVLGERTYGKGSVHALLPGDGAPGTYYATVATVTLPSGAPVEGQGVHPDVPIDPR